MKYLNSEGGRLWSAAVHAARSSADLHPTNLRNAGVLADIPQARPADFHDQYAPPPSEPTWLERVR